MNCYALVSGGMISREIIRSEYLSQNLPLHLMHWGLLEYPPSINKNTKQNELPVRIRRKKRHNLWEVLFFFFKPKLAKLRCNIPGNKKHIKAFLLMSTEDILLRLDNFKTSEMSLVLKEALCWRLLLLFRFRWNCLFLLDNEFLP